MPWGGRTPPSRVWAAVAILLLLPFWSHLWTGLWSSNSTASGWRGALFSYNMLGEPLVSREAVPDFVRLPDPVQRVRAAIVVLTRNEDVDKVVLSMRRMERRFNAKFSYPYVFLNDADFTPAFRAATAAATAAPTLHGKVPSEHWAVPDWLAPDDVAAALRKARADGVLYGHKLTYHQMCRFFSGFFFRHPLLADFDYFWRMEPDVHYYCDLDYDPFAFMHQNGIKYGFVITLPELPNTIPTLWQTANEFAAQRPDLLPARNLMDFVTAPDGDYNLCHFWSNFELGSLDFFRSEAYLAFFDFLDRQGGFFLERWGDAPVHSLGAALLLNASQVHWFKDIGYRHNSFNHCPAAYRHNCDCDPFRSVERQAWGNGRCHGLWSRLVEAGTGDRAWLPATDRRTSH